MKPVEQATAISLLSRWYAAWENGEARSDKLPGSAAARELLQLAVATRAFLNNEKAPAPDAACVRR